MVKLFIYCRTGSLEIETRIQESSSFIYCHYAASITLSGRRQLSCPVSCRVKVG